MALKPDRWEFQTDISFFMNSAAERGCVVVALSTTAGSGAAMDQGRAVVAIPNNPSGYTPVGLLLNDVVDQDLTRLMLNPYKDVVQKGNKVRLLRKGWVVTSSYTGSPAAFGTAYVGVSGLLTPTNLGAVATPKCGQFLSAPDEDGYVKVEIMLPQV